MTRLSSLALLLFMAAPVSAQTPTTQPAGASDPMHPRYKMETTLGDIVLELDAAKAPVTVLNFNSYVSSGYYNGTIFHRVMSTFMIQGGGFTADVKKKTEGLLPGIKNEWRNGLKNVKGSISMGRQPGKPDSATSQFFINVVDNSRLDQPQRDGAAYAVFGSVVEGMDTVERIRTTEVEIHDRYPSPQPVTPVETVVIKSIALVSEFDVSKCEEAVREVEETAKKAEDEAAAKMAKIAEDIEDSVAKASTTDSGLMYVILKEGTGPIPQPTDRVEVHYTGWLRDGKKFDSSYNPRSGAPNGRPFAFSLTGGVIQGWLEGVALMKVGEKRRLIIPSDLAYGQRGRSGIPPDATLTFDIELLAIK